MSLLFGSLWLSGVNVNPTAVGPFLSGGNFRTNQSKVKHSVRPTQLRMAHFSTSHVTRHTSHVTRHTSHVTRHTLYVTHHALTVLQTRSSAQGNCSAKSLAASVMSSILLSSSILPGPPCPPPVILSWGGCLAMGGLATGGVGRGGKGGPQGDRGIPQGEGQGISWSSCHILHYYMVLRPKGTSHNKTSNLGDDIHTHCTRARAHTHARIHARTHSLVHSFGLIPRWKKQTKRVVLDRAHGVQCGTRLTPEACVLRKPRTQMTFKQSDMHCIHFLLRSAVRETTTA